MDRRKLMKRRRVDLSLRVQEARDVEVALEDWLVWAREAEHTQDGRMSEARVRRVVTRLRRGIEYVTEVNPSNRPNRARNRS